MITRKDMHKGLPHAELRDDISKELKVVTQKACCEINLKYWLDRLKEVQEGFAAVLRYHKLQSILKENGWQEFSFLALSCGHDWNDPDSNEFGSFIGNSEESLYVVSKLSSDKK